MAGDAPVKVSMMQAKHIHLGLCFLLLAFPWLWHIDLGPVPAMLMDLVAYTAAALLIVLLPKIRKDWPYLAAFAWLSAGAISVLIAVLQYFDLEAPLGLWVAQSGVGVGYGNIPQANLFATHLSIALASLVWLRHEDRVKSRAAIALGIWLLLGHAIAASRTGMVELLIIFVALLWYRPWARSKVIQWSLLALVMLIFFSAAAPWLLQNIYGDIPIRTLFGRFAGGENCQSRLIIWSNVWELITLKPWTGWGHDSLLLAHYSHTFEGQRACIKLSNAHNFFLQIAFEYGLIVCSILVALIVYLLVRGKPWQSKSFAACLGWTVCALIGFHSLVEFPLWYGLFQLAFGLAVALILSQRQVDALTDTTRNQLLGRLRGLLAGIALLAIFFVAYDYYRVSQLYLPASLRSSQYQNDTLNASSKTVLFKSHILIAQVVSTPITQENARQMLVAAEHALYVAPDSRIIRKLIEAAQVLKKDDVIAYHTLRYKTAWPDEYKEWVSLQAARVTQ
jgi:O-antigen polymerase